MILGEVLANGQSNCQRFVVAAGWFLGAVEVRINRNRCSAVATAVNNIDGGDLLVHATHPLRMLSHTQFSFQELVCQSLWIQLVNGSRTYVHGTTHWFYVLMAGMAATAPWSARRYCLRTLLIATTLVAVGLGLIVLLF
jgi:hypothetical protein